MGRVMHWDRTSANGRKGARIVWLCGLTSRLAAAAAGVLDWQGAFARLLRSDPGRRQARGTPSPRPLPVRKRSAHARLPH